MATTVPAAQPATYPRATHSLPRSSAASRSTISACAGASHDRIARLDTLAARRGYELTYSVGWLLGERERTALRLVPEQAWQIAIDRRGEVRERRAEDACADLRCAHCRCWVQEAHVTELTGLLREGPAGDQLAAWSATIRIFARRERPHPGAQLTLFEAADGWRYTLWVTNGPQTPAPRSRKPPNQPEAIPADQEGHPRGPWNPGHPARKPGHRHTRTLKSLPETRSSTAQRQPSTPMKDQG